MAELSPLGRLLTRDEVAALFRVEPDTVTGWSRDGRIKAVRTPGGRIRRYREADVRALLADEAAATEEATA